MSVVMRLALLLSPRSMLALQYLLTKTSYRCRKKCFGITRIEDIGIVSDILKRLEIETEEAGN